MLWVLGVPLKAVNHHILDGAWEAFTPARAESWLEVYPFLNMKGEKRDRGTIKAWSEFIGPVTAAWADFHGVREDAWSTYKLATAPAWREYLDLEAVAEVTRDEAMTEAIAEYKRVTGEDYRP